MTDSTDLKSLMRSHRRIADICNDPDLSPNAKLFAICSVIHQGERDASAAAKMAKRKRWLQHVAEMVGEDSYWIRTVIRKDIPRYEPQRPDHRGCTSPMIRREGLCGKSSIITGFERDPLTGEATWYAYCSRHRNHEDDWRIRQQLKQWHANGEPSPAPNAGGILRRYFDTDWPALYEWAAPYQKPLDGAKPPVLPRPKLTLIEGGNSDAAS